MDHPAGVGGHVGFHGPPVDHGMVDVGYTVMPKYRHQGYGRAAVEALMRDAASLALVRSLGFRHVGEQRDDDDGLEWIFERPVTIRPAATTPGSVTPCRPPCSAAPSPAR